MKKLVSLIATVLMMAGLAAQAPATMSYQAVIRNVSGVLITNTQIGIEINIRQGSPTGTIVYTETQTPTTNDNGLVSLEIGGGDGFSAINWAADTYFIETNTAVTPPLTTYTITGVSKLMSVPYALYAKSAETITGTLPETDPMYSSSKAASITEADLTNLSNLSGINTGDQDLSGLATIPALTTGLAAKVDKVDGKGLSSNDYTSEEKTKLEGIAAGAQVNVKADWNAESGDAMILNKPNLPTEADLTNLSNLSGINTGDQDLSGLATIPALTTGLAAKVDKVDGKGLSSNDYTSEEKTKLEGIAAGAQVNVKADWNAESGDAMILNKPNLPTEADLTNLSNLSGINTGDQDLSGLATIPALTTGLAAKVDKVDGKGLSSNDYTSEEKTKLEGIAAGAQVNVKADWNAESGDAMILNKPNLPTEADLTNLSNLSGINTGDQDLSGLATIPALTTGLAAKVDKVDGKGLSSNDYTSEEKTKLEGIAAGAQVNVKADWNAESGDAMILNKPNLPTEADLTNLSNLSGINTGDQDLSGLATIPALTTGLAAKVDKVDGKGLSSNDYTSEEKTKLEGIAAGAQVNVKADWNAESGDAMILNKPTIPAAADGSETVVTAGSNVSITGTGTTESPYVINATSSTSTPLAIGQNYQGGIIFWLDATGQHGLIAATADQGTNIAWHNGVDKSTGTRGDGLYAGEMNTVISIVMQKNDNPEGSFAAQVCADYSVTADGVVYGDWYLPSFYELKLLHAQKDIVGGFNTGNYWSSTERDTQLAMYQNFNPAGGHASGALKNYASFSARAIRSF